MYFFSLNLTNLLYHIFLHLSRGFFIFRIKSYNMHKNLLKRISAPVAFTMPINYFFKRIIYPIIKDTYFCFSICGRVAIKMGHSKLGKRDSCSIKLRSKVKQNINHYHHPQNKNSSKPPISLEGHRQCQYREYRQ